ncbi:MAG: hypothetical protein A2603_05830 [Bdellovibrionales bacterium RIFOXYD1_FULL_55_31]|nr:MAG: hypothetical protein A2603_05830 [Bdellovibrionales bacterium RIFOXYD1_FULL_55_31]
MLSLLGFIIILGPLVIVHEFGHYVFARLFGVKAEVFSVGFGPKLWKRQCGETELRVSAIPLGGYVKLLGEDRDAELSPEEQKRALHRQAPWKRFLIFFGGPLFNFLLAIVVFMMILAIGEPKVANVVGRVVQGSAAEKAGFRSGDEILSVNGKPIKGFEEILTVVNESPGKPVQFELKHPGASETVSISATPTAESGFTLYGELTRVGEIDGLYVNPRAAVIGISDPSSPAAKAGLTTGDLITAIDDKPVGSWEQLEAIYSAAPVGATLKFKIKKVKTSALVEAAFVKPADSLLSLGDVLGLRSSELFVEKPVAQSPAENAGVQAGDRLIGIGDKHVQSFFELKDRVQKSGETEGKIRLLFERGGKTQAITITPTATPVRDPLLKKTTQYTIGVVPMLLLSEPATFVERVWNPFALVYQGTERVVTFTWRNLVSIRKMFTGDVSVATLGGPIMIGKIAGESLSRGLTAFLATMAILSIGLGVLNILPVPVLDGGHLLLLAIETVRGKPLTIRTMEIIQLVGLSLILLLMIVVIKNDIARLSYF